MNEHASTVCLYVLELCRTFCTVVPLYLRSTHSQNMQARMAECRCSLMLTV